VLPPPQPAAAIKSQASATCPYLVFIKVAHGIDVLIPWQRM
jgi:hypothetical protein